MGNHSTTWPCLGGSKRVAYLVFCTSLGTPCDTGGWEYFDSNSIVFHSLQVKLWGDMGDGSGTLPDHLWRCTHLHFYSSVQVTWFFRFLTCEAHLKYWAFLAFLGHPCDRAGTSFQHGEAPGAVQSPSSARGDTTWWMDPRSLRNWDIRSWKGRMSGTCYWNMKKQIIGALFVERFTYTPAEVVSVLEISLDLKLPVEMQCWVKALCDLSMPKHDCSAWRAELSRISTSKPLSLSGVSPFGNQVIALSSLRRKVLVELPDGRCFWAPNVPL